MGKQHFSPDLARIWLNQAGLFVASIRILSGGDLSSGEYEVQVDVLKESAENDGWERLSGEGNQPTFIDGTKKVAVRVPCRFPRREVRDVYGDFVNRVRILL